MPVTRAPLRAMLSLRIPPPQPTSRTSRPASGAWLSIHPRRSGLMSCSGRNSPSGSHQRAARRLNLSSSAGSAFTIWAFSQTKNPAAAGFLVIAAVRLRGARAGDFDLDAAVGREAFDQLRVLAIVAHALALVAAHRLLLALAFGVDAVLLRAFRGEVGLHGVGAAHRQALVVRVAAEAVGVADRDHHFHAHPSHPSL